METKAKQNQTTTKGDYSDPGSDLLRSFAAKIDKNPRMRAALLEAVRIGEDRAKQEAASKNKSD